MHKISDRIEGIFAHAVAMEQSGKLKSTIFCLENEIFILNSDHTVLLRFLLRKTETPFAHPVSFKANDYDSRMFHEKDGKIIFVTENANFIRTKSCSSPGDTPADIKALYEGFEKLTTNRVILNSEVLSLLEDNLSHIEISAPDKELTLIQRNIYSGAVITVKRKKQEGLGLAANADGIDSAFGPIGLRTNDFSALFTFIDNVSFSFPEGETDYCYIRSMDQKLAMDGVISTAIYDELGSVENVRKGEDHGRREIKKERGSIGEPHSATHQGEVAVTRPRRCR